MTSTTTIIFSVFLSIIVVCNGQIQFSGKCNNVTTQSMFNLTKYLGKWYEIERYPTIFQTGATCLSVDYYNQTNGSIAVQNTMLLQGHNITVTGSIEELNPQIHDGKLKLNFPDIHSSKNAEYWILGTDYTNYSVVWSCIPYNNNSNQQYTWILSRTKNETEAQRAEVYKILENNHLDIDRLIRVNQSHCIQKGHKKNSAFSGNALNASTQLLLIFIVLVSIEKIFQL